MNQKKKADHHISAGACFRLVLIPYLLYVPLLLMWPQLTQSQSPIANMASSFIIVVSMFYLPLWLLLIAPRMKRFRHHAVISLVGMLLVHGLPLVFTTGLCSAMGTCHQSNTLIIQSYQLFAIAINMILITIILLASRGLKYLNS